MKFVIEIKQGKWMLQTEEGRWFLKKYSSEQQVKKQINLVSALLKSGFIHVLPFHPSSPIKDGNDYYALMPFVHSSPHTFSFLTLEERKEALNLLHLFHQRTHAFPQQEKDQFPEYKQLARWQHRFQYFQRSLSNLSSFFPAQLLARYEEMGQYSLKKLLSIEQEHSTTAIIHGDVASHNFFRSKDQKLYLIDFDLAAKAPAMYDYMQWINRVLPLVDWELDEIWGHPALSDYQFNDDFLKHLLFPTDIYRECKRFLLSDGKEKQHLLKQIYPLLVEQYPYREAFFIKLATDLEK